MQKLKKSKQNEKTNKQKTPQKTKPNPKNQTHHKKQPLKVRWNDQKKAKTEEQSEEH